MKTTGLIILFTVLISKLAFASEFFQGQSVANLLLDCDGVLSIEKVGDVKFTPERPPQGRFDGLPAHGSIQLYFKISQFNKVGCQLLSTKYKINNKKIFEGYVNVPNPLSKEDLELQSEFIKKQVQSNQQKVYFKLDQLFGDLYQDKYHPFFPDIVEESLSFTGQLPSGLNYFVPLKINLENIYHTTAVDTWSDEKKLALAQKALQIT